MADLQREAGLEQTKRCGLVAESRASGEENFIVESAVVRGIAIALPTLQFLAGLLQKVVRATKS
jgi:hypothetical protein